MLFRNRVNVPGTLLVSDDFVKLIDVVGDVATLCVTCGVSESVRDRSTSVRISLSSLERSAPELLRASRAGVSSVDAVSRPSPKDRKSTRLNSSHSQISYAVFCLKK